MAASLAVVPARGRTTADARRPADTRGNDELAEPVRRPQRLGLPDRFRGRLIGVLLASASASASASESESASAVVARAVGEAKDALVITVVLLIDAAIGYLRESRAERSAEAVRRTLVPTVRVRRYGEVQVVPAGPLEESARRGQRPRGLSRDPALILNCERRPAPVSDPFVPEVSRCRVSPPKGD
ncbi:hypothetical protein KME66_01060 [Streptomyces sp. YPW6]|uniref:hypothetical protein n=1 Tax=Streptomyces sp. YPW6 TaxID=2840373 RepID=UPI001C0CAE21|nr:hypothetical protein [Streptomyces sp. YPW6]QWQ39739.1 hypothetical protein KME66_01060 [Streptomyces sp. YPW6]